MTAPPSAQSILVTGGAGFIGATLVRELVRRGHAVTALDDTSSGSFARFHPHAELARVECLVGAVESVLPDDLSRFDAVVHLAARVGVAHVVNDPEECRSRNVTATQALARALARSKRVPRVFAASTSEVYRPSPEPLREDAPLRATDATGRWAYAASKVAGERALDAVLANDRSRGPVHVRFFNVVGPGQDSSQGMVLPTFVEHASAGLALPIHGDGSAVRTLAHVDEVAVTLADLLEHHDVPAGPLNLGGTARIRVRELAECVLALNAERVGTRGGESRSPGIAFFDPRLTVGSAFEDIPWREPDLGRLRSLGVRVPRASVESIVRDTLARHEACTSWRRTCASRAS